MGRHHYVAFANSISQTILEICHLSLVIVTDLLKQLPVHVHMLSGHNGSCRPVLVIRWSYHLPAAQNSVSSHHTTEQCCFCYCYRLMEKTLLMTNLLCHWFLFPLIGPWQSKDALIFFQFLFSLGRVYLSCKLHESKKVVLVPWCSWSGCVPAVHRSKTLSRQYNTTLFLPPIYDYMYIKRYYIRIEHQDSVTKE